MSAPLPNPLLELRKLGESVWLDDISRGMLEDGSLARLIHDDGVAGLTSNPAIFAHAMRSTKPAAAIKTKSCVEYCLRKDASPRWALVKTILISVSIPFLPGCSCSPFEEDASAAAASLTNDARNITSVSAWACSTGM